MINRGLPARAYAAGIIAGKPAADSIPEHLRDTVREHVDSAIFVYASRIMRSRDRWERNHRLTLVPDGVRDRVHDLVIQLFQKRKQSHGV